MNSPGNSVTLGQLINKPTVLSFVYFDCPGICPALQHGISEVIDRCDMEIGKDYNVITISFNPKDDHISASKKKKNYAISNDKNKFTNWYYLTADTTNINAILKSVGYIIRTTGFDFAHPSGILVVSPQGQITRYLYGTSFLPLDFKMAILEASKGLARPTINRVSEYCFAFYSEGHKYTLQVTKISATIIIFLALGLFSC